MLDMTRRKTPIARFEDLPDWMRELPGYDDIVLEQLPDGDESVHPKGVDESTEFKSGTWRIHIAGPVDLDEIADTIDPLLMLVSLGVAAEEVDYKLAWVARYCRTRNKTWTQIGEALGMSKQAAWERFSGED